MPHGTGPAASYPGRVADLVLLTPRPATEASAGAVLPGLTLLPHRVWVTGMDAGALVSRPAPDLVLVDAATDPVTGRATLRALAAMALGPPVVAVLDEAVLAVVDEQWPMDELVLTASSAGELAARLRLALARRALPAADAPPGEAGRTLRVADVVVDEESWSVRVGGRALDLTYKEFELLRCLAQHPGRVLTRDTLLQEVWGSGYYGGTRTVDVHIRRLRAKLGPEHEALIGTIRGVGYRFAGPRGAEG